MLNDAIAPNVLLWSWQHLMDWLGKAASSFGKLYPAWAHPKLDLSVPSYTPQTSKLVVIIIIINSMLHLIRPKVHEIRGSIPPWACSSYWGRPCTCRVRGWLTWIGSGENTIHCYKRTINKYVFLHIKEFHVDRIKKNSEFYRLKFNSKYLNHVSITILL